MNQVTKSRSRRRLIGIVFALVGGLFLVAVATVLLTPDIDAGLEGSKPSVVLYADGVTEIGRFHAHDGTPVSFTELQQSTTDAVVAYSSGTDVNHSATSFLKAIVNVFRGRSSYVDDPLVMQFASQVAEEDTSLAGRLKFQVQLIRLALFRTQQQLLESIVTSTYFGRGAYGLEDAAQMYFDTSATALTADQVTLLLAIATSPDVLDPALNLEQTKDAWNLMARLLIDEGVFTNDELSRIPASIPYSWSDGWSGLNGHLMEAVEEELSTLGFTERDLEHGGFTIVSTLDAQLQTAAEDVVANLPIDRPENNRIAMVSISPSDGAIRMLYTEAAYQESQWDDAVDSHVAAGSTFKVITLASLVERGIPSDLRVNAPAVLDIEYEGEQLIVENHDGISYGYGTIPQATSRSMNTAFVQYNEMTGPASTREMAIRLGIPESTPGLDSTLTNVLGTASPRPLDMASAYSVFASGGYSTTPHVVDSVARSNGVSAFEFDVTSTQVVSAEVAASVTAAMTTVFDDGGTAESARLNRPAAGKTGTADGYRGAWFVGFVPQSVTSVAMFQVGDSGEEESLTLFGDLGLLGADYPAEVWQTYMGDALSDEPVEDLDLSASIFEETAVAG